MKSRRKFLEITSAAAIAATVKLGGKPAYKTSNDKKHIPAVISTWPHGVPANDAAWEILNKGGRALDAVEAGVRVPEADPKVTSVGYGGYPDRDGHVTLDACIMDETGNCGSVAFVEHIMHPISVARLVMEKTKHVMLSGDGAERFALDNGFEKRDLLTENAEKKWKQWCKNHNYNPEDFENHDTIGMIAIDKNGNLSGACTTSGLAWKMHGRVGDSPIIGAGMYVDNEIGGAAATGKGEAVIKIAGSFLIVELMRQGYSPEAACKEAVGRIAAKQKNYRNFQVAFIAMNKNGETGYYALQKGFSAAVCRKNNDGVKTNKLEKSDFLVR
jgi:L-asparaginase/N4-(beta-N-acetylglucosaminyl)-L-asparaginase